MVSLHLGQLAVCGRSQDVSNNDVAQHHTHKPWYEVHVIIGVCQLRLYLHGVFSLKEKRSMLKPLLMQLRRKFEVAAAEVGNHDVWQTADIAIVAVANETNHVYSVLDKAGQWIEETYPAMEIADWHVELR